MFCVFRGKDGETFLSLVISTTVAKKPSPVCDATVGLALGEVVTAFSGPPYQNDRSAAPKPRLREVEPSTPKFRKALRSRVRR